MSINTQSLFEQKCSAFGAAQNSTRFTSDFLTAVNRTIYDIKTMTGLSASALTAIGVDISLDAKYEPVVSIGVDYHLLQLGQQSAADVTQTYRLFRDAMKSAQLENFQDDADDGELEVKLGDLS
jgi:hypothetical protein